jgi:hypothetical protein
MNIAKRRQCKASDLRDYMLLDFEDGEASIIKEVKHVASKVLFMSRGTQFSLDSDEEVFVVTRLTLVP